MLLVAASESTPLGLLAVVTTGPQSNCVSPRSGKVTCTPQPAEPFHNVEPSVRRKATSSQEGLARARCHGHVELCSSDIISADDSYDHIFRSCQHALVATARKDSDQLLHYRPLRSLPAKLPLLASEVVLRICLGNLNFFQITQLDHTVRPTRKVPALNESFIALSEHLLVRRIDAIWAARQQAL